MGLLIRPCIPISIPICFLRSPCSKVVLSCDRFYLITMSESLTYSDPEKDAHVSDEKKAVYSDDAPVYGDEGVGETDAVEFVETQELR